MAVEMRDAREFLGRGLFAGCGNGEYILGAPIPQATTA